MNFKINQMNLNDDCLASVLQMLVLRYVCVPE